MIRKPGKEEFRESSLITGINTAKNGAVQAPKLLVKGVMWFYGGIIALGLVGTLAAGLGFSSFGILFLGYVAYKWHSDKPVEFAMSRDLGAVQVPIPSSQLPRFSQAFPLCHETTESKLNSYRLVAAAFGVVGLAFPLLIVLAVMIFALSNTLKNRLINPTPLLQFDHQTVKLCGVKTSAELDWDYVGLIEIRTFSVLNFNRLRKTGARRTLIIHANEKRGILSSMPKSLCIPLDLMGLSKAAENALLEDLVACRAAGGEVISDARIGGEGDMLDARGAFQPMPRPSALYDPAAVRAQHASSIPNVGGEARHHVVRTFGRRAA